MVVIFNVKGGFGVEYGSLVSCEKTEDGSPKPEVSIFRVAL